MLASLQPCGISMLEQGSTATLHLTPISRLCRAPIRPLPPRTASSPSPWPAARLTGTSSLVGCRRSISGGGADGVGAIVLNEQLQSTKNAQLAANSTARASDRPHLLVPMPCLPPTAGHHPAVSASGPSYIDPSQIPPSGAGECTLPWRSEQTALAAALAAMACHHHPLPTAFRHPPTLQMAGPTWRL